MSKRIESLEGARWIMCLIVFIHHFMLAFLPDAPILIYNDGNLAVMFFLLLSGFVAPIHVWNAKTSMDNKMYFAIETVKKRYLRLIPYVLASIMVAWLISFGGV